MVTVIILNVIVLLFAWLDSKKIFEHGLKVSFLLIFVFLAIRYHYGNDYSNYENSFNEANKFALLGIFDTDLQFEPGWTLICRIFHPIGFQGMLAVLAAFECIVYYLLIERYVPRSYYWFAVFIYVFNVGFMLSHLSAIRQTIAMGIFILSFGYLFDRKIIKYCLCIGAASFFHVSALVLLPLFLIFYYDWKVNTWAAITFFILFVCLFFFGDYALPLIRILVNTTFEKYDVYQESSKLSSGLGLIINGVLLLFVLYYAKDLGRKKGIFFKMVIFYFLLIPLGLVLVVIQRVGMYLSPAIFPVYPIIFNSIKKPFIRYLLCIVIILTTLYNFIQFFNSDIFRNAYKNYQTIFS
jgi:hypothetical protein